MFILARDLGMTLTQVLDLPHPELVAWRAFYAVERAVRELHSR